ncbi:hypothetical protein TWF970_002478 [Orbilia oligospora]|uniref:Uncharacterized protein n=1 Tax=Orbilia oligospora TaxID=2813651 RepID=A0A7C8R9H6_ORBOL|nr:hypothetical protein TWF970_002478 [Orbilia oligospora]
MAFVSLPLPPELVEMVVGFLPRRHDLWSSSLTCRQLNLISTPSLYKTIILELQDDILIAPSPAKTRYLLLNPQHPKAHLVKELGIVAKFDSVEQESRLFRNWRTESASMANEMLIFFIRHLKIGQLRTFVWRCNFDMDPVLLSLLAIYHPSIQNLYIQRISQKNELKNWTKSVFSMFSSLKGFSWHGIRDTDEVDMAFNILRASAATLETFSVSIDDKPTRTYRYANAYGLYIGESSVPEITKKFKQLDHSLGLEGVKLASLAEYQAPGTQMFLHKSLPFSQIQRLYLTEVVDERVLEDLLLSFEGLVEINVIYRTNIPSIKAITRHGETLKVLSVCDSCKGRDLPETWSTANLAELGSKCPNLVELGMCQSYYGRDHRNFINKDITRGGSREAALHGLIYPITTPMVFPRHLFLNLELLYISLPDPKDHNGNNIRRGNLTEPPFKKRVLRDIVECLNGYGFCGQYAGGPAPSKKLKVVTLGIGKLEADADFPLDPMILKTVYPFPTGEVMTLSPSDIRTIHFDGDLARWKLLRRYPLMIPTEGLSHISR